MVSFLLFLLVFVITYNSATARPMIASDFSLMSENSVGVNEDDDLQQYQMPTIIKQGTIIKINGTLDTTMSTFKVALIDTDDDKPDCSITLDFNAQTINVTPAIEDYDTASYDPNLQEGEQATFLLRLIARVNNHGQNMLAVHFQVNDEGESPQLICDINFEKIASIQMQQGVASVDNLVFHFKENR